MRDRGFASRCAQLITRLRVPSLRYSGSGALEEEDLLLLLRRAPSPRLPEPAAAGASPPPPPQLPPPQPGRSLHTRRTVSRASLGRLSRHMRLNSSSHDSSSDADADDAERPSAPGVRGFRQLLVMAGVPQHSGWAGQGQGQGLA